LLIDITAKKNAYLVSLAFFNSIEDFIFVATEDGKVLFVNNVVEKRLGYTIEEIKKMYIVDFHPKEFKEEATEIFVKLLKHELDYCALPLQTKSGSNISVETRIWLGDWNGKSVGYGMSKDITLLNETFDKFEKTFMNNPAIMAISDLATRKYIDVNDAFVNKIGYTREELIGKTAEEFGIFYNNENISEAINSIKSSGRFSDIEIDVNTKNGDTLNGVFYGEIIKTESSTHLLTVMLDITERKKADDKILYLSYHDQLTGVYNRRYFDDEIDRLDDEKYFPLTLVMADVNGLKLTNDAFGHKVGDLLLQKIANILKRIS
jgi:PAS domain S-box-containing protein